MKKLVVLFIAILFVAVMGCAYSPYGGYYGPTGYYGGYYPVRSYYGPAYGPTYRGGISHGGGGFRGGGGGHRR